MTDNQHALRRTSPIGQRFVGTCFKCGKQGLSLQDAATDECPNVRGLSQEGALLEALEGKG